MKYAVIEDTSFLPLGEIVVDSLFGIKVRIVSRGELFYVIGDEVNFEDL